MNIIIEKRTNKAGDKQHIRFVYYYGSRTDENGKTKPDKKAKSLNQYLFTKPKTKDEDQHNIETIRLVERIKTKQLTDHTKGQFGLIAAPVMFPETPQPNLVKLTLNLDIDQLTKELAKRGYQIVEAGK